MDTFLTEREGRLFLTNSARVVRASDDISDDFAASMDWAIERSNPYIKWVSGDFVEADNPNQNTQFWTRDDLEMGEYSIRYAPLNMLHKVRQPVGFISSTRKVELVRDEAKKQGSMKIEILAGMWSHVFPFEAALIDQADDAGQLFFSMECRGTHLMCAGPNGCGQQFEYSAAETHCTHLHERTSVRHIVNPTFRGGAIIIPPTKPGWASAHASVYEDAVREEASRFAELTEGAYLQANAEGRDLSPQQWEGLMASVISLGTKN